MSRPAHRLAGLFRTGLCSTTLALGACSVDTSLLSPAVLGPTIRGPSSIGAPKNAVERALAACGEKTDLAETACVRQGLVESRIGPAGVAAMIPGCKVGGTCRLTYRTRDRSGVLAVTATDYVADWLVTFDLKNPKATAADLPLTVEQI